MALQTVTPLLPANAQVASARTVAPKGNQEGVAVAGQKSAGATQATAQAGVPGAVTINSGSIPGDSAARREELDRALDAVRKAVEPVARNLLFSVDDDSGRTIVKVVDSATKEVIRQIPSEEILSIAKALDKLKGLLIKQEA